MKLLKIFNPLFFILGHYKLVYSIEPLTAAAIGSAGVGLYKTIKGGVEKRKAKKEQEKVEKEQAARIAKREKAYETARAEEERFYEERPRYEISPEIEEMMGLYEERTGDILDLYKERAVRGKLPGQDIMERRIASRRAEAVRDITQRGGGISSIGAVSGLYGEEAGQLQDIAIEAARQKAAREEELGMAYGTTTEMMGQAYRTMAGERLRQFRMSEYDPYVRRTGYLQAEARRMDPYAEELGLLEQQYGKASAERAAGAMTEYAGLDQMAGAGISYAGYRGQLRQMGEGKPKTVATEEYGYYNPYDVFPATEQGTYTVTG